MGIAAALVLVVALVLGAFLIGIGSRDPGPAEAGPGAPASAAPTPSAPTAAEPESTESPATVKCWNGVDRESADLCPPVRGIAGIRWAFPSLNRQFSDCQTAAAYDEKVRAYGCTLTTTNGRTARVVYSEWATHAAGDRHYRVKYGTPDRRDSRFNIWATTYTSASFQTSRMFSRALPFSVTVASQDRDGASDVMSELDFRSAEELAPYLR